MTHTYSIIGASCNGCIKAIQEVLTQIPQVQSAVGTLNPPKITIESTSNLELDKINRILKENGRYQLANE